MFVYICGVENLHMNSAQTLMREMCKRVSTYLENG